MGDRGNIIIKERTPAGVTNLIYFYTHYDGSDLPRILQKGLIKGKPRWDDAPYLNRIIFQELLSGDDDILGYGISTREQDNNHPLLFVNHYDQQVEWEETALSFDDFIKLDLSKDPWNVLDKLNEEA